MVTEAFDIWSSEFDNWTLDIWSFVNFDIWTSEPMSNELLNSRQVNFLTSEFQDQLSEISTTLEVHLPRVQLSGVHLSRYQ